LVTPVMAYGAQPFFARGWASLRNRQLNMFTLIALGVAAAFGFSVLVTALPGLVPQHEHGGPPVYFEASAVIVALALLGQVLELRARRATSSAVRG